jgi:hypothetical protein
MLTDLSPYRQIISFRFLPLLVFVRWSLQLGNHQQPAYCLHKIAHKSKVLQKMPMTAKNK